MSVRTTSPWPEAWLKPEADSAVVRFVVTDYADDKTPEQVKSMFPACRDLSMQPMSLRSIFINLAKSRR